MATIVHSHRYGIWLQATAVELLWSSLWSSLHGPLTAVLAHIFAVVVLSAILLPVLMYPLYCIHITHPVGTHCQFTLSWSLVLLTLDKLCITMIMIRIVRITLKAPARTNGYITAGGVLLKSSLLPCIPHSLSA